MPEITFNSIEDDFQFDSSDLITEWLIKVCNLEQNSIVSLDYIFVDDEYLLKINQEYLNHDTLTDIITFNLGDEKQIEGEIYISSERVAENATKLNLPYALELNRVIIHGLLHLFGYNDHTSIEKALMRSKEDEYLSLLTQ